MKKVKRVIFLLFGFFLITSCGKSDLKDISISNLFSKSEEDKSQETQTSEEMKIDEENNYPESERKGSWTDLDFSEVKNFNNVKLSQKIYDLISEKQYYGKKFNIVDTPCFAQLVRNIVKNEEHLLIIAQEGDVAENCGDGMMGKVLYLEIEGNPIPQSAYFEKYKISFYSTYGEEFDVEISIYEKGEVIKTYKWSNN
ncbi:MAG: hypothetical protein U0L53_00310 [Bacteroidales bacterium]|nr:hypothetical protein [Bacteroidales bacterium]